MIPSWLAIGGMAFLVALASNIFRPKDVKWFSRLRRPRWLTFEPLIPIIWTIVLICGAWSAYIVWEQTRNWWLMAFYVAVEVAIVAFNPITLWTHSLKAGAIVGAIGTVLGLALALTVLPISMAAALLLLPYLLWSPIGTYTTWVMHRINRDRVGERSFKRDRGSTRV